MIVFCTAVEFAFGFAVAGDAVMCCKRIPYLCLALFEIFGKTRDPLFLQKARCCFPSPNRQITVFDSILNVPSDRRWRQGETAHCINNQATHAAARRRIAAAIAERNSVLN
jgi:hypothetical protein